MANGGPAAGQCLGSCQATNVTNVSNLREAGPGGYNL